MTALGFVSHPLASGHPPVWASGWGQDPYGVFVEFTVEWVCQRMRWIPPGRFRMGSPKGEPGRYGDEGPIHEVTLHTGFWLFDTPCTQALWQMVMGDNPSAFKGSDQLPVERVSWNDVHVFLQRINERCPGLALTLPSEAQWEYACRAGTTTALYTGSVRNNEKDRTPALDPIAWYAVNSKKKTYPVAIKAPNAWGLYDMLGNVCEWCADEWHSSYEGAPANGTAWTSLGEQSPVAKRVVRGGSWVSGVQFVRSACRDWGRPRGRSGYIGFRCCRIQS